MSSVEEEKESLEACRKIRLCSALQPVLCLMSTIINCMLVMFNLATVTHVDLDLSFGLASALALGSASFKYTHTYTVRYTYIH